MFTVLCNGFNLKGLMNAYATPSSQLVEHGIFPYRYNLLLLANAQLQAKVTIMCLLYCQCCFFTVACM